jgi:uncharacterized membrane protein
MTRQSDRPGETARRIRMPSALGRLAVSAAAGIVAAVITGVLGSWVYGPAVGWDVAAIVFCGWVWLAIWPMRPPDTASHATAEDPNRASSDLLMLGASLASLVAVGVVLVQAHAARGPTQFMLAAFGLASVAVSWLTVHTIFTLRYAMLYYQDPPGGIDFNQQERPSYRDFAYVALTIGMTFQVSDTTLQNSQIRGAALRQGLLAYFFGAIILATAINLVAGLGANGLGFGH